MERIPAWVFWVGAVVFGALGAWSALEGNWSGAIIGTALAIWCVVLAREQASGS